MKLGLGSARWLVALGVLCLVGEQSNATSVLTVQPIVIRQDDGTGGPNINLFQAETEKIWSQAGVDVVFLPTVDFNSTAFLVLDSDPETRDLFNTSGHGQNSNPVVVNMWFVNEIASIGTTYGVAALGANGVAISSATFTFNSGVGRLDTPAHELGHNLGLGHNNFGAGVADNLMTTGSSRTVPGSVNDISPDGLCLDVLTAEQITEALTSIFLIGIPEVLVDTYGSTPWSTADFFQVSFPSGPDGVSLQSISLDLEPVNAFFDPTDNPPGRSGSPFRTSNLVGISAGDISVSGLLDGAQRGTLTFGAGTFGVGDSFAFGVDCDLYANIDGFGATPEELEGMLFSFTFDNGFTTTVDLKDYVARSIPVATTLSEPVGVVVPEPLTLVGIILGAGCLGGYMQKRRTAA